MTARIPVPTTLEGDAVHLEPLTRDVLLELRDAIGVPEVFAAGYGGGPAALDASDEGWTAWAERAYPWHALPFAIRLRHSGRLVGTTSLADLDAATEQCHLGWTAYAPDVWGTVVNAEAKLLVLGHAFAHGFGRVRIQADAANARSRAAILRLGATFEGVLRRMRQDAEGTWRDVAVHSILVDEWPAVRDALVERVRKAPRP
ncbi:GNAT family N-acetyltransferase [Agrococcus sp. SGAir0287]|uniref:GNAT family N-acetyltransferase n=1 Tax=Agrococcus sp. SGAir0287 TaxID=2070347 RepID=UPI0010CCE2F7|nr:GNAT family protein [Agrococcus sp. SGAir0287]QCR18333.1 N-acetyltransferase [Agrococcus sp. SGAir0287]